MVGTAMSSNALRGYIKALRVGRGKTQPDVASRIGMAVTTYKDWERGITKDIKTPYLVRAVQFLEGSFDQIAGFSDDTTADDGAKLARQLIAEAFASDDQETPEEASRLTRLIDLLARGVAPDEAARIVQHEQ